MKIGVRTSSPGFADLGGVAVSSFSTAVSSMSVVFVPFDEVDMGEGSASLGLATRGDGA